MCQVALNRFFFSSVFLFGKLSYKSRNFTAFSLSMISYTSFMRCLYIRSSPCSEDGVHCVFAGHAAALADAEPWQPAGRSAAGESHSAGLRKQTRNCLLISLLP